MFGFEDILGEPVRCSQVKNAAVFLLVARQKARVKGLITLDGFWGPEG